MLGHNLLLYAHSSDILLKIILGIIISVLHTPALLRWCIYGSAVIPKPVGIGRNITSTGPSTRVYNIICMALCVLSRYRWSHVQLIQELTSLEIVTELIFYFSYGFNVYTSSSRNAFKETVGFRRTFNISYIIL